MKQRILFVMVVVLVVAFLLVPVVIAAPRAPAGSVRQDVQIPSLVEFLTLLTTTVGVGMVVSFVLSQLERFQNVSAQAKFWIVFAICLLLPVGATAILNLIPAETLLSLEPYWKAVAGGFAVFIGSQVFYVAVLKKKAVSGSNT
jgi:hypothetical protein